MPCYLAMTASELARAQALPARYAWMACHFSQSGVGLSNRPTRLAPEAMLIVNDRFGASAHDSAQIAAEVDAIVRGSGIECVLLDFQRPGNECAAAVAAALVRTVGCSVGVTPAYAAGLECPVFVPPVPPYRTAEAYLAEWAGREIWLEAALSRAAITLTAAGADIRDDFPEPPPENAHRDEALACHYRARVGGDAACFRLFRTAEDLQSLLARAEKCGVTRSVGLYQELGGICTAAR